MIELFLSLFFLSYIKWDSCFASVETIVGYRNSLMTICYTHKISFFYSRKERRAYNTIAELAPNGYELFFCFKN